MLVKLMRMRRWPGLTRPAAPGELWDLDTEEALALIEAGDAVPVTLSEVERIGMEVRSCSA